MDPHTVCQTRNLGETPVCLRTQSGSGMSSGPTAGRVHCVNACCSRSVDIVHVPYLLNYTPLFCIVVRRKRRGGGA